jgi:DNA polymerase
MNYVDFEEIRNDVALCSRCSLCDSRLKTVFGEGPAKTPVVLVGEAPGAKEDEAGRPFVGLSGRFLTELLEEEGLPREKIFITNMVKCRPPENRLPSKREMEACRSFLAAQLACIRPRLVITAGNVPTRAFLGTREGISTLRGRTFTCSWERMQLTVLPLFHPSYLLRNRGRKEGSPTDLTLGDIRKALRLVREFTPLF